MALDLDTCLSYENMVTMIDTDDCAVYAIAFACGVPPARARFNLWAKGRNFNDGATEDQIFATILTLGHKVRRIGTRAKTIRTFAYCKPKGSYIVITADHAVAVIDGYICDRPEVSSLLRIENVWKVTKK